MTQYREAMRLKTIWDKFLLLAPEICPFLLGPIIFGFRSPTLTLPEVVARYAIFLLLFVGWYAVKRSAFSLIELRQRSDSSKTSKSEKLTLAALVACALATMAFLQLMRLKVTYEEFVGILLILGLGGLRESLLKKGLTNLAHLTSLIYLTGIGYISICLALGLVSWQPLFIALGYACLVLAYEIAGLLSRYPKQYPFQRNGTPTSKGAQTARPVPFLLASGPTFIASMSYMNELPKSFGTVFLTLLWSSKVITSLKDAEKSGTLPAGLERRVAGICVLFIVIIALTSYLSI